MRLWRVGEGQKCVPESQRGWLTGGPSPRGPARGREYRRPVITGPVALSLPSAPAGSFSASLLHTASGNKKW